MDNRQIIIFDGVCNFCNNSVNFIIARAPEGLFVFSPLQSAFSSALIEQYQAQNVGFDTFLLLKNEKLYYRTDAALEIAKDLQGHWYLFGVFRLVPRFVRDYFYKLLARNRYKLFGRKEHCMVPTPDLRRRLIFDPE